MDTAQEVQEVAVSPARPRAAWLDMLLSVGWVAFVAPLVLLAAMLEGFMLGEIEEE